MERKLKMCKKEAVKWLRNNKYYFGLEGEYFGDLFTDFPNLLEDLDLVYIWTEGPIGIIGSKRPTLVGDIFKVTGEEYWRLDDPDRETIFLTCEEYAFEDPFLRDGVQ